MKAQLRLLLWLTTTLSLYQACLGPQNESEQSAGSTEKRLPYPEGLSDQTFIVGGLVRQFRIHIPSEITKPKAAVLVLHGGGGEGMDVALYAQHPLSIFRTVADRENFIVVYPGGLPANDLQRNPGWVDCRSDNNIASGVNDV